MSNLETIEIKKWNQKIKDKGYKYPCEECPFKETEKQTCIIYWRDSDIPDSEQDRLYGIMEENPCYKLGCEYFREANS